MPASRRAAQGETAARSRAGTTREMNRDHRLFVQRACGIPAAKRLMGVVVMNRISATAIVRWLAAAAILVSGGEHFRLWWFAHYRVIHIIGPLFLLNAIAGLLIALLLVWRANPLIELAGLGFAVSTLGAFFISVYVGLFGFQEALSGTSQLIAGIAEGVAIVLLAPTVAVRGLRAWHKLRGHSASTSATTGATQAGSRHAGPVA